MYAFPALRGRKKLSKLKYILYLSMLRYLLIAEQLKADSCQL